MLPQDSSGFKRNRYARAVRNDSRRIVRRWTYRRHLCAIDGAVCIRRFLFVHHLLPDRLSAVHAVGVKFYAHSIRVKTAERI
jgi:hypothetical protein